MSSIYNIGHTKSVLLSVHKIYFDLEIRKIYSQSRTQDEDCHAHPGWA